MSWIGGSSYTDELFNPLWEEINPEKDEKNISRRGYRQSAASVPSLANVLYRSCLGGSPNFTGSVTAPWFL